MIVVSLISSLKLKNVEFMIRKEWCDVTGFVWIKSESITCISRTVMTKI